MNFDLLLKGKQAWEQFSAAHPQFPRFLQDVKAHGVGEGTMIDIAIRYPDGQEMKAGLRVKESDLELFRMLQKM